MNAKEVEIPRRKRFKSKSRHERELAGPRDFHLVFPHALLANLSGKSDKDRTRRRDAQKTLISRKLHNPWELEYRPVNASGPPTAVPRAVAIRGGLGGARASLFNLYRGFLEH